MENKIKRITKAQKYEDIIAMLSGNDPQYIDTDKAIEFCKGEMALLAKKNASESKKDTAQREEDEKSMALILEYLARQSIGKTCTEINKGVDELADFNNQKITSLMNKLCASHKVNKTVSKGKSLFTLA